MTFAKRTLKITSRKTCASPARQICRWRATVCVRKDLFVLVAIIAVFLTIGVVMIVTKSLPEEDAKNFHTLSNNLTLNSGVKIIKEPMPDDNTFIYAINDVAKEAYIVAQ